MLEGGADVGGDGNEGRDGGGRRRARGGTDLDAQRAYVEALDAVAWLAPERPSGRRRVRDLEVVVPGPRTGDLPQVRTGRRADVTPPRTVQDGAAPGAPQDLPPAPPLTRRERREAERRAAERRLAAPQAYDAEERRVGERRR
ncbi:MAG: hypothetical protein HY830_12045, partial [Actinobacteria bacterium]|nr:hypothetical protein [Actinomycetota bacterium]